MTDRITKKQIPMIEYGRKPYLVTPEAVPVGEKADYRYMMDTTWHKAQDNKYIVVQSVMKKPYQNQDYQHMEQEGDTITGYGLINKGILNKYDYPKISPLSWNELLSLYAWYGQYDISFNGFSTNITWKSSSGKIILRKIDNNMAKLNTRNYTSELGTYGVSPSCPKVYDKIKIDVLSNSKTILSTNISVEKQKFVEILHDNNTGSSINIIMTLCMSYWHLHNWNYSGTNVTAFMPFYFPNGNPSITVPFSIVLASFDIPGSITLTTTVGIYNSVNTWSA